MPLCLPKVVPYKTPWRVLLYNILFVFLINYEQNPFFHKMYTKCVLIIPTLLLPFVICDSCDFYVAYLAYKNIQCGITNFSAISCQILFVFLHWVSVIVSCVLFITSSISYFSHFTVQDWDSRCVQNIFNYLSCYIHLIKSQLPVLTADFFSYF